MQVCAVSDAAAVAAGAILDLCTSSYPLCQCCRMTEGKLSEQSVMPLRRTSAAMMSSRWSSTPPGGAAACSALRGSASPAAAFLLLLMPAGAADAPCCMWSLAMVTRLLHLRLAPCSMTLAWSCMEYMHVGTISLQSGLQARMLMVVFCQASD